MKRKRIRLKPRFYVITVTSIGLCIALVSFFIAPGNKWSVSYEGVEESLPSKAEELMENFMTEAYDYMATWEKAQLTDWFDEKKGEQALICQNAYDLMVEMRRLKDVDLKCDIKEVTVKITDVRKQKDVYIVSFEEGYDCQFSFMEELSQTQGIESKMVIREEKDKYSLVSYHREEDFYTLITDSYETGSETPMEDIENIKTELLADCEKRLISLGESRNNIEKTEVSCDVPIDREGAKKYALQYALTRNEGWFAFDDLGGNCQNFGSQVLFEGGIPMDIEGDEIWKYYGTDPSSDRDTNGRSSSWTGVTNFYQYALQNTGFGLCAETDANIYTAEAGDIIQVADGSGEFVHTIVSLGTINDEEGKVIDINTVSNTTDRKNYPLSAYNNPDMRLIKIYGYNN